MVDQVRLKEVANRLIAANGRDVSFIEFDTTLADPAKPWEGPADPRAVPDSQADLKGLFTPPTERDALGWGIRWTDLMANSDQFIIVEPETYDLSIFQEVIDGALRWKINEVQILRPGTITLLAFVGVSR